MKRYGLIGNPISHSLSPALFEAGYHGRYPYDLIEADDFETAFQIFLDSYDAINVTAPYKELAFRKADLCSPECKITGAANILKKTGSGILAANSDIQGVTNSMAAAWDGSVRPDRKTLIVGCGGAGKAALYAALEKGDSVILMNRSIGKAEELAAHIRSVWDTTETAGSRHQAPDLEIRPIEDFACSFNSCSTIIYTIPTMLGVLKECYIQSSVEEKLIPCSDPKVIIEANYRDPSFSRTVLEKISKICPGTKYIGGKEWLLAQGVGAYKIFTGEEPDKDAMSKVL